MASAKGIRQVGYFDCAGGGQVVVEGTIAYIGHMESPAGTSIVDVSDPANPKLLAHIEVEPGSHSHKVRVGNGLMLVNRELYPKGRSKPSAGYRGGYEVFDISNPKKPRSLYRWSEKGKGVHRFDFDGRYAYLSPTMEGYLGNIVMIVDLANPEKPEEVGRWWKPGQWIAGGEEPSWERDAHHCHHPLRFGSRLYTSYWMGGTFILSIEDMSKPKLVSHIMLPEPHACPHHTALRLPFELEGRTLMLLAEEDVWRTPEQPAARLWTVDIGDEHHPEIIGSFQMKELDQGPVPSFTACHQPAERITGTEVPVAYFAKGVRIVDISRPLEMREIAHYVPDIASGYEKTQSNDVTTDDRGLIYLIDRYRGLSILERTE